MSARLKIEHGEGAGKVVGLKAPGVYVLGRDPASSVRVIDMKVSKAHCEIELGSDGGVLLRDLKSTHGTQLNGQPVAREAGLKPGDEIRVGFTVLRLLSDGASEEVVKPSRPPGTPGAAPGPEGASAEAKSNGGSAPPPPKPPGPVAPPQPSVVAKELPPDELVGKVVGGYRVLKKIGQGGMGAVYVAEQVSLKREVALKVLSEKFVADSAFVDQFVNEARAAGQLNHPNVVQVYDVGEVEGRYFFSMEFVHGGSIEDKIRAKPAEWRAALNWFLDAANALIFAGKRGILHRDVKPDNLMLSEDGSAKLCDLGLAKKSESADLLAQGIIGTPHFISPEAIRRKPDIDGRTDLYSLGCTFFRILTGGNPYPAPTVKDILLAHLNKPVPRVADKKPDVPKELGDVVFKLMQKEPAERFQTADELYKALDKIRVQHGLAEHGIKPHSRKPLLIAMAVVVLAAAGVVTYFVTKPPPQATESEDDRNKRLEAIRAAKVAQDLAQASDRNAFISDKNGERLGLGKDAAGGKIEDTWNDPKWDDLLEKYKKLKEEVLGHEKFGEHDQAKSLAAQIDVDVKTIEDERATLAKVDSELKQRKATFQKSLVTSFDERLATIKRELEPAEEGRVPRWWEAARVLAKDEMRKLVEESRGKDIKIGLRSWPAINEEERQKLIEERFPGEDWPGQRAYEEILKTRAHQLHAEWMKRGTDLAASGTPEDADKAAAALEAYREQLTEPATTDTSEAADLLRKHRREAEKAANDLRQKLANAERARFTQDRQSFFQLVHLVREPVRGVLWSHVWSALDGDPKRLAESMQTAEYKALAGEQVEDVRAVATLFTNLVATFAAKQWTDLEVDTGEGKKAKVLEVGPEALTCVGRVRVSYLDLGPKRLLERLFLPGGQPRFPLQPGDHRGLAVLAELAGDTALAQKQWMGFKTAPGGDAAREALVGRRLQRLPLEMQAARLYLEAREHHDAILRFQTELMELGLREAKPPITEEQRAKIQRARADLERHIAEAGQSIEELAKSEELASTIWAASVMHTLPPKAAYVGESLGAPPPEPAPVPAPAAPPAQGQPANNPGNAPPDKPADPNDPKKQVDPKKPDEPPAPPKADEPKPGDKPR